MAGYGDDVAFDDWLAANGYSLPVGAPSPAVLRQRGSAYIDGKYALRFPGAPTDPAQERAWPREGAETYYGAAIANDVIPAAVIQASYAAGYQEAVKPGSLAASTSPSKQISRVKAGSVEVQYDVSAASSGADLAPVFTAIEGTLAPYLINACLPAILVV